jgi:hypothetical protein
MNYVQESSASYQSLAFYNVDVLVYIASFINDKWLLPFVLTSKSCLQAIIASHRHSLITSLNYFSTRVEMAMWVLDINPQNISKLIKFAAQIGALDVLIYLREREPNISWDIDICGSAAENGHLSVLQWLRSQDPPCPWDWRTCAYAAMNGHLHVLQWLRSQDPPCPWDRTICEYISV